MSTSNNIDMLLEPSGHHDLVVLATQEVGYKDQQLLTRCRKTVSLSFFFFFFFSLYLSLSLARALALCRFKTKTNLRSVNSAVSNTFA